MNTTTLEPAPSLRSVPTAARIVLNVLQRIAVGSIEVRTPDGRSLSFGTGAAPRAAISLRDWSACNAALRSGDIGFAESYIAGGWSTPDLVALLKVLSANRDAIERVFYGTWWGSLLYRARHLLNRNSKVGSRRNIHAHYDLGNEFYRLWLDETMNYSSAWFAGDMARPLVDAQRAKVRRALRECGVQPGSRLLEIGCGWGMLAQTAAAEFGARVVGVTLSRAQLEWGRDRLARAGLAEQAELHLQDYRELAGEPFDAVCSIEMFEAVGREYWDSFFATLRDRLGPGGRACIQTITIRDDLFERYVRSTDFIQQYIFPGGLLPSPAEFRARAARAGLRIVNELAFGADYAETLRRWRETFLGEEQRVRRLGFDTRFVRTWEFYLAYCEAAFATGNTDVVQFTLRRD